MHVPATRDFSAPLAEIVIFENDFFLKKSVVMRKYLW